MAINWYQVYQTGSKYGVILEPNSDTSGTYFTQDNYIVLRQVGSSYVTLLLLLHHLLILLFSLLSSYNDTYNSKCRYKCRHHVGITKVISSLSSGELYGSFHFSSSYSRSLLVMSSSAEDDQQKISNKKYFSPVFPKKLNFL